MSENIINVNEDIKMQFLKVYGSRSVKYKFKLCCSVSVNFDNKICKSRRIALRIPLQFNLNESNAFFNVIRIGSKMTYSNKIDNYDDDNLITVPLITDNGYHYFEIQLAEDEMDNNLVIEKITICVIPKCLSSKNFGIKLQDYFDFVEYNCSPVANNDSYWILQETKLEVDSNRNILANDIDDDVNDILTAELVEGKNVCNGTLILNENGTFEYTPNPYFSGIDCFYYRAFDGCDYSEETQVRIRVLRKPIACDNFILSSVSGIPIYNYYAAINDTPCEIDDNFHELVTTYRIIDNDTNYPISNITVVHSDTSNLNGVFDMTPLNVGQWSFYYEIMCDGIGTGVIAQVSGYAMEIIARNDVFVGITNETVINVSTNDTICPFGITSYIINDCRFQNLKIIKFYKFIKFIKFYYFLLKIPKFS